MTWTPEILGYAVLIVVALLAAANVILTFLLFRRMRGIREEQKAFEKRILKEVALNSPTRAAIAAVMATLRKEPMSFTEFEKEMASLLDDWDEIESLAETAHARLAHMVDEAERSAGPEDSPKAKGAAEDKKKPKKAKD